MPVVIVLEILVSVHLSVTRLQQPVTVPEVGLLLSNSVKIMPGELLPTGVRASPVELTAPVHRATESYPKHLDLPITSNPNMTILPVGLLTVPNKLLPLQPSNVLASPESRLSLLAGQLGLNTLVATSLINIVSLNLSKLVQVSLSLVRLRSVQIRV